MTVVIDGTTGIDTGTGSLIAANASTPTYLDLFEDTDNGSNYVRLIAPTSVASNKTITLPDTTGTVALTSDIIGVGQTWQNVLSSRAAGTTYTNSTGRVIMVAITPYQVNAAQSQLSVDGIVVARQRASIGGGPNVNLETQLVAVVPAGSTYLFEYLSGTTSISVWAELR